MSHMSGNAVTTVFVNFDIQQIGLVELILYHRLISFSWQLFWFRSDLMDNTSKEWPYTSYKICAYAFDRPSDWLEITITLERKLIVQFNILAYVRFEGLLEYFSSEVARRDLVRGRDNTITLERKLMVAFNILAYIRFEILLEYKRERVRELESSITLERKFIVAFNVL